MGKDSFFKMLCGLCIHIFVFVYLHTYVCMYVGVYIYVCEYVKESARSYTSVCVLDGGG